MIIWRVIEMGDDILQKVLTICLKQQFHILHVNKGCIKLLNVAWSSTGLVFQNLVHDWDYKTKQ
jgi:hypothetical protein